MYSELYNVSKIKPTAILLDTTSLTCACVRQAVIDSCKWTGEGRRVLVGVSGHLWARAVSSGRSRALVGTVQNWGAGEKVWVQGKSAAWRRQPRGAGSYRAGE